MAAVWPSICSLIMSAGADKNIWGWDTGMSKVQVWEGHSSRIYGLAASPDGSWFVSGNEDKSVRGWEVGPSADVFGMLKPVQMNKECTQGDSENDDEDGTSEL